MRFLLVAASVFAGCLTKPDRPNDPVLPPAPTLDANPGPIDLCDPHACAAAGGDCLGGVCDIPRRDQAITCPDGMPCRVTCTGKNACKPGVSCGGATSCTVRCEGESACELGVDCATSDACTVTCIGSNACRHGPETSIPGVRCGSATCDVTCSGDHACEAGIGASASCEAHCCDGACAHGTGTCSVDDSC